MKKTKQQRKKDTSKQAMQRLRNLEELVKAQAPAAVGRKLKATQPRFKSLQDGSLVVSQRRFLGQYNSTVAFAVEAFVLNPGISDSFPFLSDIAAKYDRYTTLKLKFHWTGRASTETSGGVILASSRDVLDPAPDTDVAALTLVPSSNCAYWKSLTLDFKPDRKERLVRVGGYPLNSSAHDYDSGIFYLCRSGATAIVPAGFLEVEYSFHFKRPVSSIQASLQRGVTSTLAFDSAMAAAGPIPVNVDHNGLGLRVGTLPNSFKFPRVGYYDLKYSVAIDPNVNGTGFTPYMRNLTTGVAAADVNGSLCRAYNSHGGNTLNNTAGETSIAKSKHHTVFIPSVHNDYNMWADPTTGTLSFLKDTSGVLLKWIGDAINTVLDP